MRRHLAVQNGWMGKKVLEEENVWAHNKVYSCNILIISQVNRAFSLTWPASMLIYWNKRKHLHEKRVKLPEDFLGTPTWPPFHCFGTPYGRRDVMWKRSITVLVYIDHHKTWSTRYKEYLSSINILPGIMFKNLARIGEKTITKLGPWRILLAIRHLWAVISYMMYKSSWLAIRRPDSAGS